MAASEVSRLLQQGLPTGLTLPELSAEFAGLAKRAADKRKFVASEEHVPTVAIDLDGTLATNDGDFDPDHIPKPRSGAKKWPRLFHEAGARVIIFTVRGDEKLVKAWLDEHDIYYDYINENPDQPEDASDKVLADVYWDDRAVSAAGRLSASGPEVLSRLEKKAEWTWRVEDPHVVLAVIGMLKVA